MIDNKRCILIVDDEVKMVRALRDFFKANKFHVLEAYDGGEALDMYYEYNTKIDIMLLDVMMPVQDGFSVLKELRDQACLVPIIMLTAKGEEYDQLKGFHCGADDYISKPFSPSLLLARVEAVLRRFGKAATDEITAGALTINTGKRIVSVDGNDLDLTRREYELLLYLVVNESMTFSREQLLDNVWGYDFDGSIRTVDTHIKQLRVKLAPHSDYIKTIHCVGYQFSVS
ncbi:MAG: response regulator transcription factor [Clostridiales bacterium]|nr:response regulator transcription factor [Clostridiales bacterium]